MDDRKGSLINITVIVKTFLRPACLLNLLRSIDEYQNLKGEKFAEVIIIDDSDEDSALENTKIIKAFVKRVETKHLQFPFNSIALSKGRNIGLEHTKTELFLLCDDDFILDLKCDLAECVKVLVDRGCDILGGYYRDISKYEDRYNCNYRRMNWLGFQNQTDEEDILVVFDSFFPSFTYCHTVQNFFIAKTAKVKEVGWNENLPMLEHVEFFDRAMKLFKLKVGFTKRMFVRHFHINRSSSRYSYYRNRKVSFCNDRPILGYQVSPHVIRSFTDFTLKTSESYELNPLRINKRIDIKRRGSHLFISLLFVQIQFNFLFLGVAVKKLRLKQLVNASHCFCTSILGRIKLKFIRKEFPKVMTVRETLQQVIDERLSLCRFGDGEFKLMLGEGLGSHGHMNEYQVYDKNLADRLKEVITIRNDKVLKAIPPFKLEKEDLGGSWRTLSYFQKFWVKNWNSLKTNLDNKEIYGNAFVSRLTVFHEATLEEISSLWSGRNVTFVCGENSHFEYDERLFSGVASKYLLKVKGKSSFSDYQTILNRCLERPKDSLFLVALGPTATVLSYDLTQSGFQSLDIGHLVNCFQQYLGEKGSPEEEHWN